MQIFDDEFIISNKSFFINIQSIQKINITKIFCIYMLNNFFKVIIRKNLKKYII